MWKIYFDFTPDRNYREVKRGRCERRNVESTSSLTKRKFKYMPFYHKREANVCTLPVVLFETSFNLPAINPF